MAYELQSICAVAASIGLLQTWAFQYDGSRGFDSIVDAAHGASQYHRQVKLGRHFRKQCEARLAR